MHFPLQVASTWLFSEVVQLFFLPHDRPAALCWSGHPPLPYWCSADISPWGKPSLPSLFFQMPAVIKGSVFAIRPWSNFAYIYSWMNYWSEVFFYKISGADLPQMILELWWLALWGEERRSISYAEIQQSDPSFSFTLSMQLSWAYTSVLLLFPFSCITASTKLVRNRIARRQDSQDSMFFKI